MADVERGRKRADAPARRALGGEVQQNLRLRRREAVIPRPLAQLDPQRLADALQRGDELRCRFFRFEARPHAARPHHCALLDMPLGPADLRLDCPEHDQSAA